MSQTKETTQSNADALDPTFAERAAEINRQQAKIRSDALNEFLAYVTLRSTVTEPS